MPAEYSDKAVGTEDNSRVTDRSCNSLNSALNYSNEQNKGAAHSPLLPKAKYSLGYKNILTGKIYRHATVQTLPSPWKYDFVLRFHRDSQTVTVKHKAQQTPRDACTQVEARNIYMNSTGDKFLETTSNYVYADDLKREYLTKVITFQKYARRWLAQQDLLRRKKCALLCILWEKEQNKKKLKQDKNWLEELQKRKLNPSSADDFRLIFSDLQKWWNDEAKCISEVTSGADLKAAMWLLVNEETKQIEEIYKKKHTLEQRKCSQERERSLKMAAKPKVWKAYDNTIQVETGSTRKANNLYDLYITLSMKYVSPQDRIDALTNLKEVIKPYCSKLTKNLIQLADREIDLLLRGVKSNLLEGLQTRIRDLFWQYAKKPLFNPGLQRTSKITKQNGSPCILCCASCKCFFVLQNNSTDEALGRSVLENYFRKCKKCMNIENEAWIRKDLELYKRILKLLITEEEKKLSTSGIIYILQPYDIGYLVENVWKHQSCLSGSRNDQDLEFTRYDSNKNWTPWNCLLVTRKEAGTLLSLSDLETKYDQKFRDHVAQRHAEAKRYFSTIPRFWPYLTKLN